MSPSEEYHDIPGTVGVRRRAARARGYHLNMFCMSLMKAENRAAFKADERAYLDNLPMTEEQNQAVLNRDWNGMLALGGNIYFTAKLGRHRRAFLPADRRHDDRLRPRTDYAEMMLEGGRASHGNRSKSEWAKKNG